MPTISVIIPCYNYGQYLNECIGSVLKSDFKDLEIIVVNDGSTDDLTLQVLNSLNQDKVRVIHQDNQGPGAARNFGIDICNSDCFLPLDSDDLIKPTLLSEFYQAISKNSDFGFVYSWIQMFGEDQSIEYTQPIDYQKILIQNHVSTCSLVRKKAWKQVGGYHSYMRKGWEDWDFWISLLAAGWQGQLIPKLLFLYRKHGEAYNDRADRNAQHLRAQIKNNHPLLYSKTSFVQSLIRQYEKNGNEFDVNKCSDFELLSKYKSLQNDYKNVINSQSWKITKPLRLFKSFFKK